MLRSRIPTSIFPVVFYFMGAIGLSLEILPGEAFAIFGGRIPGDTARVTIIWCPLFFGLGALLHVVLYRRNPERFDSRMFRGCGLAMAGLMASFFLLSFFLSRTTGLPAAVLKERFDAVMSWVGTFVVGGMIILLVAVVAWLRLAIRFHPANRIVRRLAADDFAGAIRLGEKYWAKNQDFTVGVNLCVAYHSAGETDKARELFTVLAHTEEIPTGYTEEFLHQTLESVRKQLDG